MSSHSAPETGSFKTTLHPCPRLHTLHLHHTPDLARTDTSRCPVPLLRISRRSSSYETHPLGPELRPFVAGGLFVFVLTRGETACCNMQPRISDKVPYCGCKSTASRISFGIMCLVALAFTSSSSSAGRAAVTHSTQIQIAPCQKSPQLSSTLLAITKRPTPSVAVTSRSTIVPDSRRICFGCVNVGGD